MRQKTLSFLRTVVFLGTFVFASDGKGKDLSANDLARALGVSWWEMKLPKRDSAIMLRFGDGTEIISGSMSFSGCSTVKALCWHGEDKEWLDVSLILPRGTMKTKIKDPFGSGDIVTYPVPAGERTELRKLLIKGSTENEITPRSKSEVRRIQYQC